MLSLVECNLPNRTNTPEVLTVGGDILSVSDHLLVTQPVQVNIVHLAVHERLAAAAGGGGGRGQVEQLRRHCEHKTKVK